MPAPSGGAGLGRAWHGALLASLLREVTMTWRIIVRDLPASIIPGTLFALSAWRYSHLPVSDLPVVLAKALPYFAFYIFAFCLLNQLTGVHEDQVNKPDRPFAAGLVSARCCGSRSAMPWHEVTTDRAPACPRVLGELFPTALHTVERDANNRSRRITGG
jgi:hypothetical protein